MKKTFGILAHVDAGKTTFSEQLLYHRGIIKAPGRVDDKNTFLDTHDIERKRGITVFSGQAHFTVGRDTYFLVDTPGHMDFSMETERTLAILDYAVLIINGTAGVQAHTETLWRLLGEYRVPVFLFINKTDVPSADPGQAREEIRKKLCRELVCLDAESLAWMRGEAGEIKPPEPVMEQLAQCREELLEAYVMDGPVDWLSAMRRLIKERCIFPCFCGSALKDDGMEAFFQCFHLLTETDYNEKTEDAFAGRVYKVRYGQKGERLTFIKAFSGHIGIREGIRVCSGTPEKVNSLFLVNGSRLQAVPRAEAGDLFAVSGSFKANSGDGVGELTDRIQCRTIPAMKAEVIPEPGKPEKYVEEALRKLEEEEPSLKTSWEKQTGRLTVKTMGPIQLDVLKELMCERYGCHISFGKPEVLYMETIRKPVCGYGHFEPLRHYAEVVLRLEPLERGSGIRCESRCSCDRLPIQYQNLILGHVMEKEHRGALTGYPVTDLNIVLVDGLFHIKHTEGGDFREATCRAVRQGLFQAESFLLEPVYDFAAETDTSLMGRTLSDITRLSGRFDEPVLLDGSVFIQGSAPVSAMMEYYDEFLSITKGKGRLLLLGTRYEPCHNEAEVIQKINYQKERDLDNPSSSVFCAKGTSFLIKWNEAEPFMHSKKS